MVGAVTGVVAYIICRCSLSAIRVLLNEAEPNRENDFIYCRLEPYSLHHHGRTCWLLTIHVLLSSAALMCVSGIMASKAAIGNM